MSPGVRTIPAAMVLPIAAAMPNHIPRTLSRRPRSPLGAVASFEGASVALDMKFVGGFAKAAMILGKSRNAKVEVGARKVVWRTIRDSAMIESAFRSAPCAPCCKTLVAMSQFKS